MAKNTQEESFSDQLTYILGVLWHLMITRSEIAIAFITRYYPFSLLFPKYRYHAGWVGIGQMMRLISFVCYVDKNNFLDAAADRDDYFFYLTGRLEKEPSSDYFTPLQNLAADKGITINYRGKMEDGYYKFMAPVQQNWLKVFF